MRNLLVMFSFTAISLSSPSTFGFASNEAALEGTVKSYDEKQVEVLSDKNVFVVPRNLVLLSDMKTGQKIIVHMTKTQLSELKRVPAPKN